jgi:hypothetical protein
VPDLDQPGVVDPAVEGQLLESCGVDPGGIGWRAGLDCGGHRASDICICKFQGKKI